MFCYTLFNIYQLNLTVINYQNSYPSSQKSYLIVKIVIIPTLLSDYQIPRKIKTYSNFPKTKNKDLYQFSKTKNKHLQPFFETKNKHLQSGIRCCRG